MPPPTNPSRTSDAAGLKAVADPLRIRIGMLLLDDDMTVKELAATLGVPPTRLYYHVRILEQHGLIEVAERRMVSGIEERRYRGIPDAWQSGPTLTARAIAKSGVIGALFKAATAEIEVALADRPDVPLDDPDTAVPVLTLTEFALTDQELADVQEQITQITLTYGVERNPNRPGTRTYHFLFAGWPAPGGTRAP